jgi:hypothetical protein
MPACGEHIQHQTPEIMPFGMTVSAIHEKTSDTALTVRRPDIKALDLNRVRNRPRCQAHTSSWLIVPVSNEQGSRRGVGRR